MKRLLIALGLLLAVSGPAAAVNPQEMLKDPAQEQRARELSKGLRCLVCQNQSIDDSDAELARDLRVILRERIAAGDSDSQVMDYLTARYGDYVLLKPPFRAGTLVLWVGPLLILLGAAGAAFLFYRRQRVDASPAATAAPLTDEERRKLERILREDDR